MFSQTSHKPRQDNSEHSGAELIDWLHAHPLPAGVSRTPEELDEQIARERESWD